MKKTPLDRAIQTARAALHPDPYFIVQKLLDEASEASSMFAAADACRRAQVQLARIAAGGEGFDPKRHRAIRQSLAALERNFRFTAALAPLQTR